MDEGVGGCLLGTVIVSVGIWWLLSSYWQIILGIVLVVVLIIVVLALWPKPGPQDEIDKAARDAEKGISEAGKAYRKRVNNLNK
jgi:hypothetical protein